MARFQTDDLSLLLEFLNVPTPQEWVTAALNNIPLLLLDHAHCERKAAATAITLMSKYPNHQELVKKMSPLAREELLHFEKVIEIMSSRGLTFRALNPSNYAQQLHRLVTKQGSERLRDELLIGAIIEARSCERFFALVTKLADPVLKRFYYSLVKSEARHFQDYLYLAGLYGKGIEARLETFLIVENTLITSASQVFRFHSGVYCEESLACSKIALTEISHDT